MSNLRFNKSTINSGVDVAIAIAALILAIGAIFFEAFVGMKLLNWFVIPVTGWHPVNYWLTFGISITISFFKGYQFNSNNNEGNSPTSVLSAIITYYIVYAVVLGVGALITLWI